MLTALVIERKNFFTFVHDDRDYGVYPSMFPRCAYRCDSDCGSTAELLQHFKF